MDLFQAIRTVSHDCCNVLQDFAHYKSGVYTHIKGYVLGGHAVKLIGWGTTDDGEDYWVCSTSQSISSFESMHVRKVNWLNFLCFVLQLLANQWNRGWGDVC